MADKQEVAKKMRPNAGDSVNGKWSPYRFVKNDKLRGNRIRARNKDTDKQLKDAGVSHRSLLPVD